MNIIINDAADVKNFLWRWLGLEGRSINFHLIDAGDDEPHVGSGLVGYNDDLSESDALYEIGYDRSDEKEIEVFGVESYNIGDGESWSADDSDREIIAQMMREHPIAFDAFIAEYAECLESFDPKYPVSNPAYSDWGDDDV